MDKHSKHLLVLFLATIALTSGVWYLWSNKGQTHGLSLQDESISENFQPYSWWMHHRSSDKVYAYPNRVGPVCLEQELTNQDGALASTVLPNEVAYG